ncbi:MAG: radical SAM protein, partial [Candidatus Altiarchaeota archaeon]
QRHKMGILNNLLLEYNKKLKPTKTLGTPTHIQIETTNKCNLKCTTCGRQVPDIRDNLKPKNMTVEEFKMIIDQFQNLSSVGLYSLGEPLSNPEIFDIIRLLKGRDVFAYLSTNGMLLDTNLGKRLVDSGLSRIQFSIDAADKGLFEELRPGSDFQRVCKNIRSFVETNDGEASKSLQTEAITTVTKRNIGEIPKIMRLCSELGVKNILLLFPFLMPTERLKPLKISRGEWKSIQEHEKTAEEYGITVDYHPRRNPTVSQVPCDWPWTSTHITVEGYVTPCCYADNPKIINMGNIFEDKFSSIWNNKIYQEFRDKVRGRAYEGCKHCPNMILSGGGYDAEG